MPTQSVAVYASRRPHVVRRSPSLNRVASPASYTTQDTLQDIMTPPTALDASALAVEAPPDSDDIFGPSRSFPPRSNRPKPSMISAKLRAKEERKKVIQICTEKLEKMKDPDRNLRRSVCISNTYFKLQDEVRREKQMKHMMNGSRCDDDDWRVRNKRCPLSCPQPKQRKMTPLETIDKALETIDKELANAPSLEHEIIPEDMGIVNSLSPLRNSTDDVLSSYVSSQSCMSVTTPLITDELSLDLAFNDRSVDSYTSSVNGYKSVDSYNYCKSDVSRCRSRKRSFDEVEDCDVHEVLSQFYTPPTPMMPSIDDDGPLNVVDDDPIDAKRIPDEVRRAEKKIRLDDKAITFDKMLELDTDMNQNKSGFQTLNDFEPSPKRIRYDIGEVYSSLDSSLLERSPFGGCFGSRCDDSEKKSNKSEFEIILDALRLDDTKEVCEREDLMYFCNKGEKLVSDNGDIRTRYLSGGAVADSCGQAAILGDQQSAGFHGLLASLET